MTRPALYPDGWERAYRVRPVALPTEGMPKRQAARTFRVYHDVPPDFYMKTYPAQTTRFPGWYETIATARAVASRLDRPGSTLARWLFLVVPEDTDPRRADYLPPGTYRIGRMGIFEILPDGTETDVSTPPRR